MTTVVRTHLEVTGEREAKRDVDSVGNSLGGLKGSGVAAAAGLAAATAAISAATVAAVRASKAMHDLAMRGGEVDAIYSGFARSGGTIESLRALEEATGGLVNQADLMRRSTQIMRTGLTDFEQMTDVFAATTRAAQDMGKDVNASLDRITQTLSGGGIEAWRDLGVNVVEVQDRLRELGLTMESVDGRTTSLDLITRQLVERYGEADNSISNYNDAIAVATAGMENYRDQVGNAIANNEVMIALMEDLGSIIEENLPATESMAEILVTLGVEGARALAEFLRVAIPVAQTLVRIHQAIQAITALGNPWTWLDPDSVLERHHSAETIIESLGAIGSVTDELGDRLEALDVSSMTFHSRFRDMADDVREMGDEFDEIFALFDPAADTTQNVPGEATGGGGRSSRGGGGGGGGIDWVAVQQQSEKDLAAWREQMFQDQIDAYDEAFERRMEQDEAEQERIRAYHEEERNRLLELNDLRDEGDLNRKAFEEEEHQRRLAEADELARIQEESQQRAIGIASAVGGAMNTLGGIMQQVIQQQEASGKSAEALKKVYGGFLVVYNSVMAATEIARAIGSYPDPIGIIAHAASAAAHIAAAAMAASDMGGGSPKTTAAPTSTFVASQPDQIGEPTDTRQSTTIVNQYSIARSEPDLGYAFERAVQARQASRLPDPSVTGVQYEL